MTVTLPMRVALLASVAALMFASTARAQTFNVKLGLWEVTTTTKMSGAPPIDTSKLPPDQRARVEAMMKEQFRGAPRVSTDRQCLTKEKLEKDLFGDSGNDKKSCKRTVVANTATVHETKLECTGDVKMSGDIRFEAVTPENAKGTATMLTTSGGKTMSGTSTFTAKWLSSSCGDVK